MKRERQDIFEWLIPAALVFVLLIVIGGAGIQFVLLKARIAKTSSELVAIGSCLGRFHQDYGYYPTGTSHDVLDALMGKNPKGVRYLVLSSRTPPFLDAWGEPYLLVPASGPGGPGFRSKGPDRVDNGGAPGSDDLRLDPP